MFNFISDDNSVNFEASDLGVNTGAPNTRAIAYTWYFIVNED